MIYRSSSSLAFSTLSFSRTHFQQLAQENSEISEKGKYLNKHGKIVRVSEALQWSIDNSKHYHHKDELKPPPRKDFETKIHVCFTFSIQAALKLKERDGSHVGILNSANATKPGGKYLSGCLSQESCLCRGSLLWPTLAQFENKKDCMYTINTTKEFSQSPSSCAIFSPNVPVIRRDAFEAQFLEGYQNCSFVSIPPPNAFELASDVVVRKALRLHLYRALCIFAQEGCESLVLCTYGCGTRGNDPEMVACVFKVSVCAFFKYATTLIDLRSLLYLRRIDI
jgi:uncharacterized protein (TIGR02452 family)